MRSSFGPASCFWIEDSISVAGTPLTDVSCAGAHVCGFSTLPALAVSCPRHPARTAIANAHVPGRSPAFKHAMLDIRRVAIRAPSVDAHFILGESRANRRMAYIRD